MEKRGYDIRKYVKGVGYVAVAVAATVLPGGYAACAVAVCVKRYKRKKAEVEKEREKESELIDIIE